MELVKYRGADEGSGRGMKSSGLGDGQLDNNFLKMAPEITVGHLCAFVRHKLQVKTWDRSSYMRFAYRLRKFRLELLTSRTQCKKKVDIIYRTAGGEDVILGESLCLEMICGNGATVRPNPGLIWPLYSLHIWEHCALTK